MCSSLSFPDGTSGSLAHRAWFLSLLHPLVLPHYRSAAGAQGLANLPELRRWNFSPHVVSPCPAHPPVHILHCEGTGLREQPLRRGALGGGASPQGAVTPQGGACSRPGWRAQGVHSATCPAGFKFVLIPDTPDCPEYTGKKGVSVSRPPAPITHECPSPGPQAQCLCY